MILKNVGVIKDTERNMRKVEEQREIKEYQQQHFTTEHIKL